MGLAGLMNLVNQVEEEQIEKYKFRGIEVEIRKSRNGVELTIKKVWHYTGFETKDEAVEFAGQKTAKILEMLEKHEFLERVAEILNNYGIDSEEFLKIAEEACKRRIAQLEAEAEIEAETEAEAESEADNSRSSFYN